MRDVVCCWRANKDHYVPLNYCASLFHLDQFPDEAFGPRMRSMYDLLVQIGIPSSIDGATVLHAGLAYVNPAVDLESESGKRGPIGVNTTISGVSGCGKTVAKNSPTTACPASMPRT